jgi:hypothetical protein
MANPVYQNPVARFDPRRPAVGFRGAKQLWPWLAERKLLSGAYAPAWPSLYRYEGWLPYFLPIPCTGNGLIQLAAGDTLEFQAVSPVSFLAMAILAFDLTGAGAQINSLFDASRELSLINPNGPALNIQNLGGDGKHLLWLRRPYVVSAGASLMADVSNLNATDNFIGQITLLGFEPPGPATV